MLQKITIGEDCEPAHITLTTVCRASFYGGGDVGLRLSAVSSRAPLASCTVLPYHFFAPVEVGDYYGGRGRFTVVLVSCGIARLTAKLQTARSNGSCSV